MVEIMKMFDLHNIMKRAWQIKRQDERNIFSLCLKMAWEEAKEEQKLPKLVGTPKQVAWAEKLRERHLQILRRELERANSILIARGDKPLSGKRLKATMKENSAVYFIEQRKKIEDYSIIVMSKAWEEDQRQRVEDRR